MMHLRKQKWSFSSPTHKLTQNTLGHTEQLKQFILAQFSCFSSFICSVIWSLSILLSHSIFDQNWPLPLVSCNDLLLWWRKKKKTLPVCRRKMESKLPIAQQSKNSLYFSRLWNKEIKDNQIRNQNQIIQSRSTEVETPDRCKSIKKSPRVQQATAFKSGGTALCLPTKINLTAYTHRILKPRLRSLLLDRHSWKRKILSSLPAFQGMVFLSTTWAA